MTIVRQPTLVGRDAELARLANAVRDLTQGRGGIAWLEGEPGIGKSALLGAAVGQAEEAGVTVCRVSGDELVQIFGLRTLADGLGIDANAADPYRREIARLLAGGDGGVDVVSAATERILGLIDRECAAGPVLLALDDLQWADSASIGVWHLLCGLVDELPLLLVSARRRIPQRPEVDALWRSVANRAGSIMIELEQLGPDHVRSLAAALLQAEPGPNVRRVLDQASGNPLYARELVDVLLRDQLIRREDGVAELTAVDGVAIVSVGEAIGRRLSFLARPTRTVLRAAAILGNRFTLEDLALVSDRGVPGLSAVVADAIAASVLVGVGSELTFRHPLIRQALYDEVPPALRAGLHAHVAHGLASAGVSWQRVAQHLLAAPSAIDGWALTWLTDQAESALYAQPPIAADLLRHALRVTPPGDARRGVLAARLATVLRLQAKWDDLIERGRSSLEWITEPSLRGQVATHLLTGYFNTGRYEAGLAEAEWLLGSSDLGLPWRNRIAAVQALLLLFSGETANAMARARAVLAEGEQTGDAITVGMSCHALVMSSPPREALDLVDRALSVLSAEDPQSLDLRLSMLSNKLVFLSNLDRSDEVRDLIPRVVALAESAGSYRLEGVHTIAGMFHYERGNWDETLLFRDMVGEQVKQPTLLQWHGLMALIAVRRGDSATARRTLEEVANLPYRTGRVRTSAGLVLHADALLAEADGRGNDAVAALAGWLRPEYSEGTNIDRAEWMPELTRLALAVGDSATAAAAARTVAVDAARHPDDGTRHRSALCQAMLADDPAPMIAAADYFNSVDRLPESAFACAEAAVRLAQRGDLGGARESLERAATFYDDVRAVLDLQRLQARLRPYGVRRGPRSAHRRPERGWESLTAAEHQVVRRLAWGESNPEIAAHLFLSRRTVQTHVSHVLRKLGLRSRAEIAIEAVRSGYATGPAEVPISRPT